jgi:hypothetical protein
MAFQFPKINKCSVIQCSYNLDMQCHTPAITVGADHAACDTYIELLHKGGFTDISGRVGACHESDCGFNKSLECSAPGIEIGQCHGHADCLTYNPQ